MKKPLPPQNRKHLRFTRFGNPILRKSARLLTNDQILSDEIQMLIDNIRHTNLTKDLGVGIAAPQVGESVALSVIDIRPSKIRPNVKKWSMVIINPTYEGIGRRSQKWEGCLSSGKSPDTLFAKVPRYSRIRATWLDENAVQHEEELSGIIAHVFQHETDHLNGILFVDKVKDTSTYMLGSEYRKRILSKTSKK